jgi:hypothetical protein
MFSLQAQAPKGRLEDESELSGNPALEGCRQLLQSQQVVRHPPSAADVSSGELAEAISQLALLAGDDFVAAVRAVCWSTALQSQKLGFGNLLRLCRARII